MEIVLYDNFKRKGGIFVTYAQLKDEIIAYSKEIGIDKIGFATADPFEELKEKLQKQQLLGFQSGFEESDIEKRTNPELLLPKAKSIIAIALAYPSLMKDAPKGTKEDRRGIFCRASWGLDYHFVLRDRLEKLEKFISEKLPEARIKTMVDTGELSDRAVAERAGIGWSGKNCSIISPEFGSYIYLGEMITTIPFPPDQQVLDQCGTCTKCIDACPTDALVQGGQINAQRCISFLTQTKDFLPEQFREKIGNRVYGCDTCQQVCPENKGMDFHIHTELEPDHEVAKPKLKSLLQISNRDFKDSFGTVAGSWRGKKPIQRNAIVALGNFKDKTAVPMLIDVMKKDQRPVIRGTAAWSLGKIGGDEACDALVHARDQEQDIDALIEIEKGLQTLGK